MNLTKIGLSLTFSLLVLLSALTVVGTTISIAAQPSNELSETAPLPFGKELAVTGEVVMIEGNMQIVEDPSGKNTDVRMIMENLFVAKVAGDEAIQFHINEKTRLDQDLTIGDKVEVLAAQNGEALSIKKME
jgi:Cu/Ag efflux protein CusF